MPFETTPLPHDLSPWTEFEWWECDLQGCLKPQRPYHRGHMPRWGEGGGANASENV